MHMILPYPATLTNPYCPCVLISIAVCAAPASTTVAGEDLLNRSYYPSRADAANNSKRWYIIDAEGQTLGRLATLAATYIRCVHRSVPLFAATRSQSQCGAVQCQATQELVQSGDSSSLCCSSTTAPALRHARRGCEVLGQLQHWCCAAGHCRVSSSAVDSCSCCRCLTGSAAISRSSRCQLTSS
jgi:hypothetical protein